ncbi:MAG TPA: hypothetical protein VHF06_32255 [Pseudonocardiaceae bacterium]|nr:hypothetical protein [Pseudonocardiaceae bacterium]
MSTSDAAEEPTVGSPAAQHHESHDGLVTHVVPAVGVTAAKVDAIVVPTGRHVRSLHTAIGLASALDCTLLLLCSKYSRFRSAADLAANAGVDVVAIDASAALPARLMPEFETTSLLAGKRFERRTDTSLKRNLGLLLARLAGWERVVFLDDDIAVPNPDDLVAAARLLDEYDGVGLEIGGFPDNSVVCHAYREAGSFQDTFIGGGALAFGSSMFESFFPNIYNEDWFFLLGEHGLRRSAVTGLAVQKPYDPFANDERARSEEFGDCVAEGVFGLLDQGGTAKDADLPYWRNFLAARLRLITSTIDRIEAQDRDAAEKRRMVSALKAARGRCQLIEPQLCIDYMDAWLRDLYVWRDHLDVTAGSTTVPRGIAEAVGMTGLNSRAQIVPKVWRSHRAARSVRGPVA